MYSMANQGRPSAVLPASNTRAMCGWSSTASACRSARKRATASLPSRPRRISLSATLRCTGCDCSAR
jgi:hypothetical protein